MSDADPAAEAATMAEDAGAAGPGAVAPGTSGVAAHRDDEALESPHGAGDHGGDHGHDDHGHEEEALGPIDWGMWLAGIGGVALGLVVAWVIAQSTGFTLGG